MKTIKIVFGTYHNQLEDAINREIKNNHNKEVKVVNAYTDNKNMHFAVLEITSK